MTEVIPVERIMIVHFNKNLLTTVIIHYSPCEGSNEAEDQLFQQCRIRPSNTDSINKEKYNWSIRKNKDTNTKYRSAVEIQ